MLKDTLPRLYAQPCGRRLAWTCLAYRAANPAISNRNSGQTQQAGRRLWSALLPPRTHADDWPSLRHTSRSPAWPGLGRHPSLVHNLCT